MSPLFFLLVCFIVFINLGQDLHKFSFLHFLIISYFLFKEDQYGFSSYHSWNCRHQETQWPPCHLTGHSFVLILPDLFLLFLAQHYPYFFSTTGNLKKIVKCLFWSVSEHQALQHLELERGKGPREEAIGRKPGDNEVAKPRSDTTAPAAQA